MLALGKMGRSRGLRLTVPAQLQHGLSRTAQRGSHPLSTSSHPGAPTSYSSSSSSSRSSNNSNNNENAGGAFVSKHFAIGASDLSSVVGDTGYFKDYRLKPGGELFVKTCFGDCSRQRKGQTDNAWKLLIRRDGSFYCHRCSDSGNWYQLRKRLFGGAGGSGSGRGGGGPAAHLSVFGGMSTQSAAHSQSASKLEAQLRQATANGGGSGSDGSNGGPPVLPNQKEAFGYHLNLTAAIYNPQSATETAAAAESETSAGAGADADKAKEGPSAEARQRVLSYLRQERGLNDEVIQRYGVGVAMQSFPFYPEDEDDGTYSGTGTAAPAPRKSKKERGPVWREKICVTFPWIERRATEEAATVTAAAATAAAATATAAAGGAGDAAGSISQPASNSRAAAKAAAALQSGRPADQPAGKYVIKRIKMRALDQKGLQRVLPKGGAWAFFGWHTVQPHHKAVVITEGEYDAMAVSQALSTLPEEHDMHAKNLPAISLPNGCNSLPPALLPALEQFEKIYLWLDNDKPGQESAEKFARKLGVQRCVLVRPPDSMADAPKDANDALRQTAAEQGDRDNEKEKDADNSNSNSKAKGKKSSASSSDAPEAQLIPSLLAAAEPLSHDRLETFSSLRGEVLRSIREPESITSGTPVPSLPALNKKLKGFRKGELVILTGPTGCGKTTMLSQMSLDFAKAGSATLWGSFEIKNARLIEKMLQQYACANLKALSKERLDGIADDFEGLPMHFMNFHAGSDLGQVLEAMDFAVYV